MSNRTLTQDEQNKLKRLVDEAINNAQHIKDLRESFRDTVKAVAEELDMKPKTINKAIKMAMNASLEAEKEELEEAEDILINAGRA
jgi:hypothetical protein